ncbi:HAMP domain-containing protein [Luedemannella flava]
MLAAALTALLIGRRVTRPISALTVAARRLGSGDLANRVPVTGRDEIADLAREFNRMAASLADSEERERRLIADIAHELRTPWPTCAATWRRWPTACCAPTRSCSPRCTRRPCSSSGSSTTCRTWRSPRPARWPTTARPWTSPSWSRCAARRTRPSPRRPA